MKMVQISLDVDGTLAHSIAPFIDTLHKDHGMNLQIDEITRYSIEKTTGLPQSVVAGIFLDIWDKPETIPLVSKRIPSTIRRLNEELGFKIRILTGSYAKESKIKEWLSINDIHYDSFVQLKDWREKPHNALDMHIDDHFSVSVLFAENRKRMILLEWPWNKGRNKIWDGNEFITVAKDWTEAEDIFVKHAATLA